MGVYNMQKKLGLTRPIHLESQLWENALAKYLHIHMYFVNLKFLGPYLYTVIPITTDWGL